MTEMREQVAAAVAVNFMTGEFKKLDGAFRKWADANLVAGESIAAVDPATGEPFGHATRARATWTAVVTDEAALMAHLQDADPESLLDVDELCVSLPEAIAALKQSHPEMVTQRVVIREQVLNGLIKQSEAAKKPTAPGIEVSKKPGSVRLYPDRDNPEAITRFIRSGAVPLTYVEPAELPGGTA